MKPNDTNSAESADNPTLAKITLSLVISLIAIGHVFRPKVFDEFVTLLLIVALSPWLVPFFSRYIRSVDAFGAKFEFQELKAKVETESQRLDQLYRLSMGDNVFTYLRKLSQDNGFGPFYVSPAMPREIAYLEELGYIRFKGGLRGTEDLVEQFPDQKVGANLSDYIALTDAGKSFYRLRQAASLKPANQVQKGMSSAQ